MKRYLPIIILILAPLSLLLGAKPTSAQSATYESYIAQPGDSLWQLAQNRAEKATLFPGASEDTITMAINAVKNLEIMINNLDYTNHYLEVGSIYQILSQTQVNDLTYQVSKYRTVVGFGQITQVTTENAGFLLANPRPNPDWQELRITAQYLPPNIIPAGYLSSPHPVAEVPKVQESSPVGVPAPPPSPQLEPIPIIQVSPAPLLPSPSYLPDFQPATGSPQVQGAHTSLIPPADSPLPY